MNNRIDELLDERHKAVLAAIEGVQCRLDVLNGRTRAIEVKAGVLSWAYAVGLALLAFVANRVFGGP